MSRNATHYCQCRLVRVIPDGRQVRMLWIPSAFAVNGNALRLHDAGRWVDGWIVESAGPSVEAARVDAFSRDHRHQRAASDVDFAAIKRENERASS